MADTFFFVGLPYLAVAVLVVGTIYRFARQPFGVSALSSQSLESRALPFGTLPWHLGIFVVFAGHAVALLLPETWASLMAYRPLLLGVEILGFACATLCLVGLGVLFVRRLTHSKLQAVTTRMDLVILGLLIAQIALGMLVATTQRWGAQWSTGTTTPYLWGLITLEPDMTYVSEMHAVVKIHLIMAWFIILLVPFSRLVHMFAIPIEYLWRAPQKIVWSTPRRVHALESTQGVAPEMSRRHLVRGLAGVGTAMVLVSAGVLSRLTSFFRGPTLKKDERAERLEKRLDMLKMTSEQAELELERMQKDMLRVATLGELEPTRGRYFIDYEMRPALAFLHRKTGLPLLISAKCTHLGCTVGNLVNEQNRILCPCHVSWFDINDGKAYEGPAKDPLPHLGWLVKDTSGEVVAHSDPQSKAVVKVDLTAPEAAAYGVFIARPNTEA